MSTFSDKDSRQTVENHTVESGGLNDDCGRWQMSVLRVGQSNWPAGMNHVKPWTNKRVAKWHELWAITTGKGIVHRDGDSYSISQGNLFFIRQDHIYEIEQDLNNPIGTVFVKFQIDGATDDFYRNIPEFLEGLNHDLGAYMMSRMLDLYWEAFLDYVDQRSLQNVQFVQPHFSVDYDNPSALCPFPPNPVIIHSDDLESKHSLMKIADAYFDLLITEVIRIGKSEGFHVFSGLNRQHLHVITSAARRIQNEPKQFKNVSQIAQQCNYSTGHFTKLFKAIIGQDPQQYIINCRINKARHWLAESELSIKEIADALGYSSAQFFARQFKGAVGVSPRSYRSGQE